MLAAVSLLTVRAADIDLNAGLEAYWTFDEGTGATAGDVSGNGRGTTIWEDPIFAQSQVLWTPGRFGTAIDFDGTYFLAAGDYYGIGGTGARTISAWVKTDWVPNNQGVMVAWGPNANTERWHFKLAGDAGSVGALRTENQGGNNFAVVPVNDGQWHHVVCVFPEGGAVVGDVDHYVDGVLDPAKNGGITNPVNTNVDPAVAPPVTLGGSPFGTGFRYTTAVLDDVRIYSRALNTDEIAALAAGQGVVSGAPPAITVPDGLSGAPFYDPTQGLTATVSAVGGATVNAADVVMIANGADVTGDLVITGGGAQLTVQYNGLAADQRYAIEISATDSESRLGRRKIAFSTFREDNFTIEAENYNFAGGGFIDDPILCNTYGSEPGCYFDRISVPGVDSLDANGFGDDDPDLLSVYRFSSGGAEREEEFDTFLSSDVLRSKYEGLWGAGGQIMDFDIDRLGAGDWANYTRTFPTETFSIFLRVAGRAAQTVRLDRVTSDPAAPDQTLSLVGYFHVPVTSGYIFVPLTDLAGGTELTVNFSGQETLRLTTPDANANLEANFLMFVPAEETFFLPTISIASPAEGSIHPTGGDITVVADAADEDGFVKQVTFFANGVQIGQVTEAPFQVLWPAVPAGNYALTAEAVDDDDLAALSSPVSIIVDSDPPVLGAVRGSPTLDVVEVIFNEPLDATTAETLGNYTVAPALAISSATLSGQKVLLSTAPQANGTAYAVTVRNVADQHSNVMAETIRTFTAATQNLAYGLQLYLTFDDGTGPVAKDLSGYGHDATMYAVPNYAGLPILWAEGKFTGAVDFDGSYFLGAPNYMGIGGANARTISLWIKTDAAVANGNTALVGWGSNANTRRWHFKLENTTNGSLRTENAGGNNFGEVTVNDGQWHHIAAVFPEFGTVVGDTDHYIDAILDAVKNGGTANVVDTDITPGVAAPVTVGGGPLGLGGGLRPGFGLIDDVRIYDRALSQAELTALAQGQGVIQGGPGPLPELAILATGNGSVTITWTGGGNLQSAPAVTGDWTDVAGATTPHTVTASGTAFYRVVR